MTSYIETIGEDTASVNRTFNAANQLVTSADTELGTSSFYYDNNGNLNQILPPGIYPGDAGEKLYNFNQRNLLTGYQFGAGSSVYNKVAEYLYDGSSNRLQQIDHTSTNPITTTYTNDIIGLAQVLASDSGLTTTHMLFGLDLIAQDDGTDTRYLLADGLGTVRTEMVGSQVETTTTYEPYGKLLQQTGSSGTVYGYTGEAHDGSTSLVFLRARYYSPDLKVFISRDPFPGYATLSISQNGYTYVHANPVNLIDPSGKIAAEAVACTILGLACVPVLVVGGIIIVGGIVIYLAVDAILDDVDDITWEDIEDLCRPPQIDILPRGNIEDLVNDLDLFPKAEPEPTIVATPVPVPLSTLTPDNQKQKHIALGLSEHDYLANFFVNLNRFLMPRISLHILMLNGDPLRLT